MPVEDSQSEIRVQPSFRTPDILVKSTKLKTTFRAPVSAVCGNDNKLEPEPESWVFRPLGFWDHRAVDQPCL